ncbi:MAG: aminotransferase class IV [Coriobacteriia bacterium]|nr:aminotransferase class IV [Coriobacteriia bacterium]
MHTTQYVYLNGSIVPASEASISPFDVGILRGYAVFDLAQTVHGRPFMLDEHLQRFRSSAGMLGLEVPLADEEIADVIAELLKRNGHTEATIRLVLTGGESPNGMHFNPATPTFFIITHELFDVPEAFYRDGAALITREYRRELPEAKTTNYLTWLRTHPAIEEAGAIDVLYHDGGYISEAATASFYIVRDGTIFAPDAGVLWGTIGSLVLELAKPDYAVIFAPIALTDALSADEAFITSSVRGVVPVVRIDEHTIGDGSVGPVVSALMGLCRRAMHGE